MATTTNFGWETPDDSDLVKDGAQSIRTLGSSIDTSLADLKGGTTGQVLSKATNTDMDFAWVTPDDADAIQNSIIDAKGDLIVGTAADTPARLAVGTDGQVLTADAASAGGVKWAAVAAGGMTLIASGSLSGSSVSLNSISGTYKNLQLVILDWWPSTNAHIRFTLNNDTGANYTTGGVYAGSDNSNGTYRSENTSFQASGYSPQINADNNNFFCMNLWDYANTTSFKAVSNTTAARADNNVYTSEIQGGQWRSTSAVSSIQIKLSGGTFSGGTYKLFGVN